MGKRHDKKKKVKVVLSLAEFNEDAGTGGIDPELSALPSAPKAAEDWEAEGGRPEYNSRGYKERKSYADRNYDGDGDDEDFEWVRKGPLEAPDGNSFGVGGADRDWGGMRRGPVDGPAGPTGEVAERDWNGMRRGPVESSFGGPGTGPGVERDWGARKGPIEAEVGSARVINDDNWGSARGNAVEAAFPEAAKDSDWGKRKGPVEAKGAELTREKDWTAPRKGPVESEFAIPEATEPDWGQRKGPVEATLAKPVEDTDWTARKGPVDAEVPEKKPDVAERDWSARRGPVEKEVETAQKAVRDIDFGDMRRGAKLQELEKKESVAAKVEQDKPVRDERWRRDTAGVVGRRGPVEARMGPVEGRRGPVEVRERPASTGHDGTPKMERDWGAARRTQPMRAIPRQNRASTGRVSDVTETSDTAQIDAQDANTGIDEDDWTTVRNATTKRTSGSAGNRRFSGKDSRGAFQQRGSRELPAPRNKTTTSPVSPVASAVSES